MTNTKHTYYMAETQDRYSSRKADPIKAVNLSSAKRQATRSQLYQGTVLKIGARVDEQGYIPEGALLSVRENGRWQDVEN